MATQNNRRFFSHQYNRFDISQGTNLTEWTSLLNYQTVPSQVSERQEGDVIFDQYTGTQLMLFKPTGGTPQWTGVGGSTVRLYEVGASAVSPHRLVKITGNSAQNVPQVIHGTANVPVHGIAMSGGNPGDKIYVLVCGTYLLEPNNAEAPSPASSFVEPTNAGKYQTLIAGDYYCAWVEISDVVINGTHYSVVQFRIPILSFVP